MKRVHFMICAAAVFSLVSGNALAGDSIKNRFGITGKIGFIVPADSEDVAAGVMVTRNTDVGFIGGGGFIYGFSDSIAGEFDVTHTAVGSGSTFGDFGTTNVSFGAQYRYLDPRLKHLVPYAGLGLDILLNDASNGNSVDNVVGIHANAGIDYFIQRQLALNVDLKGVIAPDADIHAPSGSKVGNFDPNSFSTTFGLRFFFN